MAFAQTPADSRSACIAVISQTSQPRFAVEQCKPLGAPLVFVCADTTLQWWKQGTRAPEWLATIASTDVDEFFKSHREEFAPQAVYRKTWGRFRSEYQLTFVDLGLMPLVEEEVGTAISNLIERSVAGLKTRLKWDQISAGQGHWLLKTVFWLLSGKILHDKGVDAFSGLDLTNVEDLFRRVALHYGAENITVGLPKQLDALTETASQIARFSSLSLATTESLAYVYENALVSKQTRSSLGTHSTPPFLVDYIVGNLADWIQTSRR